MAQFHAIPQAAQAAQSRLVDLPSSMAFGLPVEVATNLRGLMLVVLWDGPLRKPGLLRGSESTWQWLVDMETQGGRPWAIVVRHVEKAIHYCAADGVSKTCDLGVLNVTPPPPRPKPRSRGGDRLSKVSEGITELVAVMAPLCDGRPLRDEDVIEIVTQYGKLRDQMRVLRESMDTADGQFEVAQAYLTKMVEAAQ